VEGKAIQQAPAFLQEGRKMSVLLGFDPGGEDGFGWCVADYAPELPLPLRALGVVDNVHDALREVMARVSSGEQIVAAGIDAPLFWVSCGDRKADCILRTELRQLGSPHPGGTVQAVNSLRGACLVQGMLTAVRLRETLESLPITESHPKAILWLLRVANRNQHPSGISLSSLSQFQVQKSYEGTDHERDAALAMLSAWAMLSQPPGWRNLYGEESRPYSPLSPPLGYWMPEAITLPTENHDDSREDQAEQAAVLRYSMSQARKLAQENSF
jgi:hypothetical protein